MTDTAPLTQPCGCPDREGHVDPCLDVDLGIGHGERSASCGDPLPHAVPGTGEPDEWFPFHRRPDAYCLCGHPGYHTCEGWLGGYGVMGLTVTDGAP